MGGAGGDAVNKARQEWDSRIRRDVRRAVKDAISAIETLGDDTERDPVMDKCMRTLERLRRLRDKLEPRK